MQFTALLHRQLKRGAAAGADEVRWQEYGDGLEERLADLHGRIHRGAYHAKPSRRVWIDKEDGRKRPLGIAAIENKVVQAAVVQVLDQVGHDRLEKFVRHRIGDERLVRLIQKWKAGVMEAPVNFR